MKRTVSLIAGLLCSVQVHAADMSPAAGHPPHPAPIKVAFVLTDGAVPIDFAGPWEVFESTHLPGDDMNMDMEARMPFELYTVGASTAPIHSSGSRHPGMTITPDYDFKTAPEPDLVIIPAERSAPGMNEWLRKLHDNHKTLASVCAGAFRLAETGLLDGKPATSHHDTLATLAERYPRIKVQQGARYVQSADNLYTSAGLSAGIDLALHIVAQYYGTEVAQQTADTLEYEGKGWK